MDFSEGSSSEILGRLSTAYGVETQKQLAEKLGVSPANVSNWVQRNSVPGSAFVRCVLDTGCDLVWLTTGKNSNANSIKTKSIPKVLHDSGEKLLNKIIRSGGKAVLQRIISAYNFDTQKELSEHLGISTGTISTWIRREYFPAEVVITCALETEVSLQWLATGTSDFAHGTINKELNREYEYTVVRRYMISSGELIEVGNWIVDAQLVADSENVIYVEKDNISWLVDKNKNKPSNGTWLLKINNSYDMYDVEVLPGNKIDVIGSISKFSCFIHELEFIGLMRVCIKIA